MSLNKKSVDDINVKGQRVLVRCDFNVPLKNGVITDENRLVAALPTIKKLIADGGKIILCSHLGKVKTEEDKLTKSSWYKRLNDDAKKYILNAYQILHKDLKELTDEDKSSIKKQINRDWKTIITNNKRG